MLANYDFDIRWIIPRDLEADPAIGKLLGDIGFNGNARGNYIALFRDPAVIAMIERADPLLREYLKTCGFGFVPSESGLPAGLYPAEDGGALTDVKGRLQASIEKFSLQGADLGGFNLAALLSAIAKAQPLPAGAGRRRAAPPDPDRPAAPPHIDHGAPTASTASTLRGRLGALVLNLAGLCLVFYVAVKLFATPAPF